MASDRGLPTSPTVRHLAVRLMDDDRGSIDLEQRTYVNPLGPWLPPCWR
jgi:hypothetical protein